MANRSKTEQDLNTIRVFLDKFSRIEDLATADIPALQTDAARLAERLQQLIPDIHNHWAREGE